METFPVHVMQVHAHKLFCAVLVCEKFSASRNPPYKILWMHFQLDSKNQIIVVIFAHLKVFPYSFDSHSFDILMYQLFK